MGEARDAVITTVDLQECAGVWADGLFVIGKPSDIRGADLAQDGAADGHDLGNAKAAADLNQLATRDDDFLALAEGAESEDRGRRIVVDGRGRLGPSELAD